MLDRQERKKNRLRKIRRIYERCEKKKKIRLRKKRKAKKERKIKRRQIKKKENIKENNFGRQWREKHNSKNWGKRKTVLKTVETISKLMSQWT